MTSRSDCLKMMALGRQFTIGAVYNCFEDVVVPNARLWDPDDVARLAVVESETKESVKVHAIGTQLQKDGEPQEDDDGNKDGISESWMSNLGMDDHTAMSLMAGLLSPSSCGAWQYAVDRANWAARSFCREAEVIVHCRRSSKKVSIDPTSSQLEIICRPESLIKSQATHVVVAITYGQEAICVFSNPKKSQNMLGCAQFFAGGLLNGRNRIESDREDDEEDDGHQQLITLELQCVLYSDSIAGKKGPSWTLNPVAQQYDACREMLGRQVKTVPLTICLYPLRNLSWDGVSVNKFPRKPLDVPRAIVVRCQSTWNRLRHVRINTLSLMNELDNLEDCHWMPRTICDRIKEFNEIMKNFATALLKALSDWTLTFRRGAGQEEEMSEMIEVLEYKSPFVYKELIYWLNHQRQQMKTLKLLAQLPGVLFVSETDNLAKEIKSGGTVAVVLHMPSLAGQSDFQVHEMSRFVEAFQSSSWQQWAKRRITLNCNSVERRRIFATIQEFSEWIVGHNSDTKETTKYIVFYDERLGTDIGKISPFMRMWDCKSERILSPNFTIPRAPGKVTVDRNRRGIITLTWTVEETAKLSSYLFQYRNVDKEEGNWESVHCPSNTITIDYLQSDESYVFRAAVLTQGGKSPFSQESDEVTIDPVCPPPSGLQCRYSTDTSITISWDHQLWGNDGGNVYEDEYDEWDDGEDPNGSEETVKVVSYSIECWMDGHQESMFIQRSTTEKTLTLEPLDPDTVYCVQIRAVCMDQTESTFYSPTCAILRAKTLGEPERAAEIVRRVSQRCFISHGVDGYKLPVKKLRASVQGVGHYVFGEKSYSALIGKRRQRTILMLGATGSGKTTLINAMVNYILGVEWEDDFRFKLIDESANKSQAHSQTDLITTYDLYEMKGSRLGYSLTVVDTPGFGDTRGVEKDKQIMDQIQKYFKSPKGIRQLEAVCFVVQASLPRLTATQKYIFDSILSIFGNDIKDNIRLMVTFSDSALPPVLGAIQQAGIPSPINPSTGLPLHHKFNNSIFFAENEQDQQTNEVNGIYYEMAVKGFDRFFDDLSRMDAKSLTLTREVLEERKRLEALVEGLQMRTQIKLTRVDEFQQMKKILEENKEQIEANKDFEFEVELLVPKAVDISRTGQFTTNCQKCRTTCHFPCRQSSDDKKGQCSVMDPNGNCTICSCPWNGHFNQKFRFEMGKEKVKRSSDALRKQYQGAVDETLNNEELLSKIQVEIDEHEKQLMELMQATYPCIQRLNEIALRPHPFSAPDYIDLMITAEKQEHRPGFQQRIVTLQKLRQMAEITATLIRDQRQQQNRSRQTMVPPKPQQRTLRKRAQ